MYIRDVEPNGAIGVDLLDKIDAEEIIDRLIEEPLKKPCKEFYKKGIRTIMSSANKNNIVPNGESPKKKKDVSGKSQHLFLDGPTFEDAGVGYAWIMLDFDTLSDENKESLLRLEEREDDKGNKVGEEAIWFVHPTIMGNIEYRMKTGRLDPELVIAATKNDKDIKPVEIVPVEQNYVDFENKAIILRYNNRYPENTVILRMPVNESTTVEEVEEYFCKIAELLKEQKIKTVENNMENEGR